MYEIWVEDLAKLHFSQFHNSQFIHNKIQKNTLIIKHKNYYIKLHYILYKTSRKERGDKLIADWHKNYNASKFVLNQKQERKWALELVR